MSIRDLYQTEAPPTPPPEILEAPETAETSEISAPLDVHALVAELTQEGYAVKVERTPIAAEADEAERLFTLWYRTLPEPPERRPTWDKLFSYYCREQQLSNALRSELHNRVLPAHLTYTEQLRRTS